MKTFLPRVAVAAAFAAAGSASAASLVPNPNANTGGIPTTSATSTSDAASEKLFSSLGLVEANYKPIPVLPTTKELSSNGTAASPTYNTSSSPNSFQVLSSPQALNLANQKHNTSEWGQTSLLYIPATPSPTSNSTVKVNGTSFTSTSPKSLAASTNGQTMGPGGCPVYTAPYTPNGGWDKLPAPVYPAFDPVKANIFRYRQQVSVNLGSWFVAENWMEPTRFACSTGGQAGELDLLTGYGSSANGIGNATVMMEQHWDTWVTEADFQKMASLGINTVRLPIGYWSIGTRFTDNSPFAPYRDVYNLSWRYIARAINWAAKYDIGVLVDLHGAYGSQNGQSHSGVSDGVIGFFDGNNMAQTTALLVWLANEISDVTNVVGIELLNEPVNRPALWPWYNSTMDAMRAASTYANTLPLYFHDAFSMVDGSNFVASRNDFVVTDHHAYYVYNAYDQSISAAQHVSRINGPIEANYYAKSAIARRNMIVGEWSCALAPSSLAQSSNPVQDQTNFCESEARVWSATSAGWHFWSWTMENCDSNAGWCFQATIKQFLKTPFNAWGLPDSVGAAIKAMSATRQADFTSRVITAVQNIQLPVLPTVPTSSAKAVTTSTKQTTSNAKSLVVTSVAGALGDSPRIGKVFRRGAVGSLAARAAAIARDSRNAEQYAAQLALMEEVAALREESASTGSLSTIPSTGNGTSPIVAAATAPRQQATATVSQQSRTLLAQNSGYSDGFLSAKIFASSTSLSRLGFSTQYMMDSWSARLKQGKLIDADASNYSQRFAQGVADAESAIVLAIQNALKA